VSRQSVDPGFAFSIRIGLGCAAAETTAAIQTATIISRAAGRVPGEGVIVGILQAWWRRTRSDAATCCHDLGADQKTEIRGCTRRNADQPHSNEPPGLDLITRTMAELKVRSPGHASNEEVHMSKEDR
jgi:hypothetical protein